MKLRKLDLLHEFLSEQMNHWLLFPAALVVMGLSGMYARRGGPNIVLWALCGLLPPLFFIVRDRFNRFFPFLLLHIAAAAPAFLFPFGNSIERFLCVACSIGYLIHSFFVRMKGESPYTEPFHPAVGVMLSAISILLQRYQGENGWDAYHVISLVFCLAIYALILYIRQYKDFLAVNESSTGYLPAADMFRSGFLLVLVYVVPGALLLILCANIGDLGYLWASFKRWLVSVLRQLFSGMNAENQLTEPLPEAEMPIEEFTPQIMDVPETFIVWRILEIAALIVMSVALILFLIWIVIALIQFIRHRFVRGFRYRKKKQDIELEIDVREKCDVESIPFRRRRLTEFLSPAQRIRRLFKKRLLADVQFLADGNPGKLGLLTPKECGKRLEEEQMAQIYEQVRYSGKEATNDTLRQMKTALRQKN